MKRWFALAAALASLCLLPSPQASADETSVTLWHAYGEAEARGLHEAITAFEAAHPGVNVTEVAVPFGAYASKLESAIPTGNGPDVFIVAHDGIRTYVDGELVASIGPIPTAVSDDVERGYLDAFRVDNVLYGLPIALKCTALYVNEALLATPPASLEEFRALAPVLAPGVSPLAFETDSAYYAAAVLHAFGGELLDATGHYTFTGPSAERTVAVLRDLVQQDVVPQDASGALVTQLFASGRAAAAISGPWLATDLPAGLRYRVVPLPTVGGHRMRSFVSVEGALLARGARDAATSRDLIAFLASPSGALPRALIGRQTVTSNAVQADARVANDSLLSAFRAAASHSVLMPTHRKMRAAFEPANRALRKALEGEMPIRVALAEGAHRFEMITRETMPAQNPTVFLVVVGLLFLVLTIVSIRKIADAGMRARIRRSWPAYRYVLHAALAIALLVILPLLVGAATSFFAGHGRDMHFVGVANYVDILTAQGGPIFAHGSFWLVLLVTVLWTVLNLLLHVSIGVALALALHRPMLKMRGAYRVLLILPWAVPSYVTALAWKGMFHRQLGSVNAILSHLGVEPVSWFAHFSTAFAANLATNTWLGFPFMMVVTLGALASIPNDLYEAASVDGATSWQRFRFITLPLLGPALAPAVAMGAVWTFNMFNVVFLVSGGEPDGTTEILVSEAYRWAFTRSQQYGYAAAYAVLIFLLLVGGNRLLSRNTEPVGGTR
ncbi:MAG: extracellular solute-binding protein [Sandaracinaceae bacterium]|nr:extracellular solute-binding protein [Sandaracinaceae bacterium]